MGESVSTEKALLHQHQICCWLWLWIKVCALIAVGKGLRRRRYLQKRTELFPTITANNVHLQQIVGTIFEVASDIFVIAVVCVSKLFSVESHTLVNMHTTQNGNVFVGSWILGVDKFGRSQPRV